MDSTDLTKLRKRSNEELIELKEEAERLISQTKKNYFIQLSRGVDISDMALRRQLSPHTRMIEHIKTILKERG